jgi:hypothetical protein
VRVFARVRRRGLLGSVGRGAHGLDVLVHAREDLCERVAVLPEEARELVAQRPRLRLHGRDRREREGRPAEERTEGVVQLRRGQLCREQEPREHTYCRPLLADVGEDQAEKALGAAQQVPRVGKIDALEFIPAPLVLCAEHQ